MPKKNSNHTLTVQKAENAEIIQVSLSLPINVKDDKIMLAEVLRSAIVDQVQSAKLPVPAGTYTVRALITLTKG